MAGKHNFRIWHHLQSSEWREEASNSTSFEGQWERLSHNKKGLTRLDLKHRGTAWANGSHSLFQDNVTLIKLWSAGKDCFKMMHSKHISGRRHQNISVYYTLISQQFKYGLVGNSLASHFPFEHRPLERGQASSEQRNLAPCVYLVTVVIAITIPCII